MKPPTRRRSAPRRYNTPDPLRATTTRLIWTTREKQELLRSLKRQLRERTPKLTVQGRSDQEDLVPCASPATLTNYTSQDALQRSMLTSSQDVGGLYSPDAPWVS
ncbi:hypothetical protein GDO81_020658 [Engystomops pustulosus]|nr:hypothetical protein GDO81_020658 [Engystomops pustulosus]KAG8539605.1 hypothetical protein GDO81_020658 [Engystomops pustulosus]